MTPKALRFVLALACALVAAGSALGAVPQKGKPDGTFVVTDGSGVTVLTGRGSVLVRLSGRIQLRDYDISSGPAPAIVGCATKTFGDAADPDTLIETCTGDDIRVQVLKDSFRLRVTGTNIYVSAIGRGSGTLKGDATAADTGTYSVDDSDPVTIPTDLTHYHYGSDPSPSAPAGVAS
jgi:hypothetical protein